MLTARGLNIAMEAAMTYKAERGQMLAAMDAVSAYVGSYRRGMRSAFSSSDRAKAMGQDEKPKPNADNPGGSKGKDGNGPLS